MHEFDAQDLAKLYKNPFAAPALERARDDFRIFFQSSEQFSRAIKHLQPDFVIYARFCKSIGTNQAKSLMTSAINYTWRALSVNKDETLNILAHVAADMEVATDVFWSLIKRYPNAPWRNETNLLRDRVSQILAFAAEYIEGVLKRDMWSLLALRDIANRSTKLPLRWQSEVLGNIVSAASSLPDPLGAFIGQNPLTGITLNQFRNIGAHKDFSVEKDVITLFPKTQKMVVTFQDLENGLEILGRIRVPLKLSNTIACMHDVDGIVNAGFIAKEPPEAIGMNLSAALGAKSITLVNIRYVDPDTEVTCRTDEDYSDEDLLFLVLQHVHEFISAYENTFGHTSLSKIKVLITNADGKIMQVVCNTNETLNYLNTVGYSEIPFELTMNGVTGMGKIKVNIGNKPMKLG